MKNARKNSIFYSLPEIWDFCLEKIYDKSVYVQGLTDLLVRCDINKKSRVLDAGCGSGFPALDLIENGYRVIATDKSSEMVRQIGLNAKMRGLKIEAYHCMWSGLGKFFGKNAFNFVYCRGNSLVYAASWEQNWIVPARSREEIKTALYNFYHILKPGGFLYVDITNRNEKAHEENIGTAVTERGPVKLTWRIEHGADKIRTWTIRLTFAKTGVTKSYKSYSYLLTPNELTSFLKEVGFSTIEQAVRVVGENNYDVFLARK